jgi:hypothetical protein
VACGALLVLIGVGLLTLFRPWHDYRQGHYLAGRWLAEHASPADVIYDDHFWASYYAGRLLHAAGQVPLNPDHVPQSYYVLSRVADGRGTIHPFEYSETRVREQGGHIVFAWPERLGSKRANVVIYQVAKSSARP